MLTQTDSNCTEEILIGGLSSRGSDEAGSVKGSGDSEEAKLVKQRIDATISFHDNQIPICKFKIYQVTRQFIDKTILICLIIYFFCCSIFTTFETELGSFDVLLWRAAEDVTVWTEGQQI
jgi:hypothetical protein